MERRATKTCEYWLDPRGFVHSVMRPDCQMDVADARDNVAAVSELLGGKPSLMLVDMRGMRSQTREARQYLKGPEAEQVASAVALLIGSPVSRVLGNFFLRLGAHRVPTALFTTEEEAIRWLMEQA